MQFSNKIFFKLTALFLCSCTNNSNATALEHNSKISVVYSITQSSLLPIDAWRNLIKDNQNKSEMEKLELVNNFFNQNIRWMDDTKNWKKNDYWATPVETLTKQAGDCEDFCIAKYHTLLSLGVPTYKLRITYAKDITLNKAHIYLTYYPFKDSDPLILDNKNHKILNASQRIDLLSIYSFNSEGVWITRQNKLGKYVGGSQRISIWAELSERISTESLTLN